MNDDHPKPLDYAPQPPKPVEDWGMSRSDWVLAFLVAALFFPALALLGLLFGLDLGDS